MSHLIATGTESTPTHRSYWVIPDKLLAGSYPGESDPEAHRARLERLWREGVRSFVNLMEVGEVNNAGEPFRPYLPHLEEFLKRDGGVLHAHRLPIVDNDIPSENRMVEILDVIDYSLERNHITYVHCFGGIGRTATVIGCWLIRHGHTNQGDVLDKIAELRQADVKRKHRAAPETSVQCRFVEAWKAGQ